MKIRGMYVTVAENGDLMIEGVGVVVNPLRQLDLRVDIGQLWLGIWAEALYDKPNAQRIRALLLNSMDLSVQQVIQAITTKSGG